MRQRMLHMNWGVDNALGRLGLARRRGAIGFGAFLVGIGVGVIGGCAAAMLLTPFTGGQAREKLLRAGNDIGRTVSAKMDQFAKARHEEAPGERQISHSTSSPRS